jgi:hypothetical protein
VTYLSICLSIYFSICLSIYPSSIYISICLSIYPIIYLSIYVSVYLSVCLPIYIYISICLSIHLSICLSIHLSIFLSIYLPIWACCLLLAAFLVNISWTLKMEAVYSPEKLLNFYWTARYHIPVENTLYNICIMFVWSHFMYCRPLDFSIYLIVPDALGSCSPSASNRHEYQEFSWG